MKEITLNLGTTIADTFNDFIIARKAKGLAEKTLESYKSHFKAIARHLDMSRNIEDLNKSDTENMIASMRDSGLATNSINSYTRLLKAFLSWCNEEDITQFNIKIYRSEETVKETYTDRELAILLKKPKVRECCFGEYRDCLPPLLLRLASIPPPLRRGRRPVRTGQKKFIFAPESSYSPTDLTYKATDTLTSGAENSCTECAAKHNSARARENAGYADGTQLAKIKDMTPSAANTSGCRGIYFDRRKGLWEALIIFQSKRHRLGYFKNYDDAAAARKKAENIVFGEFLEHCEEQKCN